MMGFTKKEKYKNIGHAPRIGNTGSKIANSFNSPFRQPLPLRYTNS